MIKGKDFKSGFLITDCQSPFLFYGSWKKSGLTQESGSARFSVVILVALYYGSAVLNEFEIDSDISAVQKIKKLSETPRTVPIVAKLCMIDSKNRKIAEKLVQPVTPHLGCF